jgi:hypothetical protein
MVADTVMIASKSALPAFAKRAGLVLILMRALAGALSVG